MLSKLSHPHLKYKHLKYINFQYFIKLNLSPMASDIDVYLYTNDHVLIPRYSTGLYGSVMKKLEIEKDTSYFKKYYVRKNRVMKQDRNGQRCAKDETQESVGRCIVRYLEDTNNCTAYQLAANRTRTFCTKKQMGQMVTTIGLWETWPEADILNETGCLPHCERDTIALDVTPEGRSYPNKKPTLTIIFLFEDGSYTLEDEYIVYDIDDFIADCGGYLGLLLGHSMLSIYYMSVEWFGNNNFLKALYYSTT